MGNKYSNKKECIQLYDMNETYYYTPKHEINNYKQMKNYTSPTLIRTTQYDTMWYKILTKKFY